MNKELNKTTLHWNGTSQNQRLLRSLLPDSVKVDERSMSDILAFVARYADLVKFFDPQNSPIGDWSGFVKKNISIFLSSIVSTDLHKIEHEHARIISILQNAPRAEEKLEALDKLMKQILDMAIQINDWYVHSMTMDKFNLMHSTELENELENAIKQQLASNLVDLLSYQQDLGFNANGNYSTENIREKFHANWFKKHEQIGARKINIEGRNSADKIKDYAKKLRIQYRTFYSVTAYILQISPKYLLETITKKTNHRPDMSLIISFTKIFKKLQDQLNTLTERHLDFYYYNILRQKQQGLNPDKVNVYFNIAKHVDNHFIEKGTKLYGGKDENGVQQIYQTDYDLEINQATINSLKSLYVSKNSKISIGSSYKVITNLYAAQQANSRDGKGTKFINNEENWPTFGHEILELPKSEQQMEFAEIGWAFASPILEMSEGHRVVTFKLEFVPTTMYTLNLLIKDISINEDISREDAFSKIFKNSLDVSFTTEKGWYPAYTCEVMPPKDIDSNEVYIIVTLDSSSPAVIPYDAEKMGGGYHAGCPIVRFKQRPEGAFYTYSFLKELELQTVGIDVHVSGVRNLQLSNDLGAVYPNVPFQPFGPIPKIGSYFIIGKAELQKKELTDLKFNLEWFNLPKDKKGFKDYFKEYGYNVKNEDFKFSFSALNDNKFFPENSESSAHFNLFNDDPENPESPALNTKFQIKDLNLYNLKIDEDFELPPMFSNDAKMGYFKMELLGPDQLFGHEEYSSIYAKKVKYNNDPKRKGAEKKLPRQPYSPTLKSISLDYAASTEINILSFGKLTKGSSSKEQIYHIHPFGIDAVFDQGKSKNRSLIPNYDDNAYLFIGLKDLEPPSFLSFYFELKENTNLFSDSTQGKIKPEVVWSYMVGDAWKDFSQTKILLDTTNGFNNSGIVNIDIPRDITMGSKILPQDQYWLKISVKGDPDQMPRCLHLATQAVSATWIDNGASDLHLEQPLPPFSVNKLLNSISQIRGVHQPFSSFGGRKGESKFDFYTRTSERLRHKNRAISAWDYERLVLNMFPNIHQVKCVTHVGNEEHVKRGTVVLVVIPKIDKSIKGYHLPIVNATILNQIKEYLQSVSSPFVNIKVRNPIYERVKITAGLRFVQGKNNGTYLKKLNQDIIEFLCPWMLGKDQELQLGGTLVKDVVLSFIENVEYVEFVTKFSSVQVFPKDDGGFDVDDTAIHSTNSPIIYSTKPWSILIPFENNPLYFVDDETFQMPEKASISSMIIDGDFVMTEEKERDLDDYLSDKRRKKDEDDVD